MGAREDLLLRALRLTGVDGRAHVAWTMQPSNITLTDAARRVVSATMRIRCLGPLGAAEEGRDLTLGGPKQRLLLAHLVIHANEVVGVDRLIAAVWGDDPPRAVRSSLQSFVSHLRKAVGPDRIEGRGRGYALRVATDEVDRMRFEALVARERTLRATDPAAAVKVLTEALDLWQGTPFADLSDAESLQPEITRLGEVRAAAIEDRVAAELDRGRGPELVAELEARTAESPLRERAWVLLMVALYRSGRQADAPRRIRSRS